MRANELIDKDADKDSRDVTYHSDIFNGIDQQQITTDILAVDQVQSKGQFKDKDIIEVISASDVLQQQEKQQLHDYTSDLGIMRSHDLVEKKEDFVNKDSVNEDSEETIDLSAVFKQQEQKQSDFTFNWGLRLSPSAAHTHHRSIYAVDQSVRSISKYRSRQEVDFRLSKGGLNIQGLLRQSLENKQSSKEQGVLNQAYYDGQFSPGLGWTLGKKVMTWGVGFGFKPLDLVQREDVRSINAPPLVGSYIFALDQYTENRSLSVIFANPFLDRASDDRRDPSVSFRWYRLAGSHDFYGTVRLSKQRKAEAGLGFTHIINDEWSVYGSGLYQVRSHLKKNTLLNSELYFAYQDPMQAGDYGKHWKALLGAQWTGKSGLSVLFEGWYDGDAYTKKDWNALNDLTQKQKQITVKTMQQLLSGNVSASSQAFLAPNLLRENALFRVSYDDSKGRKSFADVLITPRDGGGVFSLGFEWERNRSKFSTGYRQYLSKENSAYGQAPIKSELWGQWRVSF